jgi:Gnt-I system low-affinity gluconate transporter
MSISIIGAVIIGIIVLLLLLLKMKIPAFISLLIASIVTGLLAGLNGEEIIKTIQNGMGGTLGFVATVVGLGAIFGGILEKTNSANIIAQKLLGITGEKKAPLAMMITGFFVAIPVFFDVGFIILFPIIHALHKKTGKSITQYAVPLLAGLAVTHACIPPTPGPIAVAEIIGASLAWVIVLGVVIGLPMAYVGGILYGKYIGERIDIQLTDDTRTDIVGSQFKHSFAKIIWIIFLPIILIVLGTVIKEGYLSLGNEYINQLIVLIGHPFTALIIANLLAWYLLGKSNGLTSKQLGEISSKSLYPAGIIILVTGAGGVYKQTLVDTGAGELLATQLQSWGLGIVLFAFLAALMVRVLQGSATVAMITAAGLVAPLLSSYDLSGGQLACLVIAISSGATMMSHLNDSGFWLVKEYLMLTEKQGFKIWTVASSIIGLVGGVLSCLVFYLL